MVAVLRDVAAAYQANSAEPNRHLRGYDVGSIAPGPPGDKRVDWETKPWPAAEVQTHLATAGDGHRHGGLHSTEGEGEGWRSTIPDNTLGMVRSILLMPHRSSNGITS